MSETARMPVRDPHRFVNELDQAALDRLIARLESRAQDAVFSGLFDKYVSHLDLSGHAKVLEMGCGTGANLRTLAKHGRLTGRAVGIDQCEAFINAAITYSQAEKINEQISFHVGDAHGLDFPPASFDVVIAHTLISHVSDPGRVLSEMARVLRPGGTAVIFDGDYASLTYACPDPAFGRQMDAALANATFNNPSIMRELPHLLPVHGLKLTAAWGDAVAEIGQASYFESFAETYVPYVKEAGALPEQAIEAWHAQQKLAMKDGTFFASCNYYTFLVSRA